MIPAGYIIQQNKKMFLPECQLHIDKAGSNTNSENYKVLKENNMCYHDNCPHQVVLSSNHPYTALVFINGRGQSVCCCVIIAGESIGTLDILGIDVMNFGEDFINEKYKDDDELL